MGVSNGYDIGVNGRDLILKTSGKIYVKVADKFYELDFRNEKQKTEKKESSENKTPDVVLLDTLTKENYPGDNKIVINNDELYITKGGSYKKINDSTTSVKPDVVESYNSLSNDLFVQISDNVWGLGETTVGTEIEFVQNPAIIWNDYCFFSAVQNYFFDDVYGDFDEETFWINTFFNVTEDDPINWIAKSKEEIENTVLSNIYKNQVPVKITDFKSLYESFWYSNELFETKIAEYSGHYAELHIEEWTKSFSPKSEITINGCLAIVTAMIGDVVIIKFKDDNATLNAGNIQKTEGSIIFCKKNGSVFMDITNSDLNSYDNSVQNINDIRVRLGDLDAISGYSGSGAIFNQNVSIFNGPFILNGDGSGNIGEELYWDSLGKVYGPLVDKTNQIEELKQQLLQLSEKIQELEKSLKV